MQHSNQKITKGRRAVNGSVRLRVPRPVIKAKCALYQVFSTLPDAASATPTEGFPDTGTPAGTVVLRSGDLRFPGEGTVLGSGRPLRTGEMALFCRPVVTAPAFVRRDGTVLADAWPPDLIRLGELESRLGNPVSGRCNFDARRKDA